MLLSIITRTYGDRSDFLKRAAAFVFQQTYRPIEWIVVQDGHGTAETSIKSLECPNGVNIRLICNSKLGRSEAANAGLRAASGSFLCFFDDDDEIFPHHGETLIQLLLDHPDASGAYAAAYQTSTDGQNPRFDEEKVFFEPTAGSELLIWRNLFPIQAVIFKKSAVRWNRFDPNLDALEDWLFWLSIFLERKIVWSPIITSRFYIPEGNNYFERLRSHEAAHGYFDIQRSALLRERSMQNLAATYDHYYEKLLELGAIAATGRGESAYTSKVSKSSEADARLVSALTPSAATPHSIAERAANESKTVVYTSINLAYLPKALVLAKSVKEFHPDWQFHILLDDEPHENLELDVENVDRVTTCKTLDIPKFHSWAFSLSVVEFCCATKPFYLRELLDRGYKNVLYLDPDTKLFSRLDYITAELQSHHVLLTPHCELPAIRDSEVLLTERSVLAHGLYNLGFIAVRNTPEGREVVDFWADRMVRYCVDDQRNGLFTDQKWFNLVPLYFPHVQVIRHQGCNVASWNISHRPISRQEGVLFSGSDPLLFFHFSGYDGNVPRMMFEIFGQYNETLEEMLKDYALEVSNNTTNYRCHTLPWAYSSFENGVPISDAVRRFYRSSLDLRLTFPEPFFTSHGKSFYSYAERTGFDFIEQRFRREPYG